MAKQTADYGGDIKALWTAIDNLTKWDNDAAKAFGNIYAELDAHNTLIASLQATEQKLSKLLDALSAIKTTTAATT